MTGHPMTGHRGRELLGLGALVLLLGVAFITLLLEPTQASARPDVASARPGVAGIAATVIEAPEEDPAPAASTVSSPAVVAAPAPVLLDGMRLRVARLGIDLPLLHGDTARDTVRGSTPDGAAFLLPTTAPPGSGGNSYIYAHARPGMFLSLWDIRLGDVVEVTAPSGEVRRYVVTEIHSRVAPTDVQLTLPTVDERITLQTSTGPRDADPRFVVVAVPGG